MSISDWSSDVCSSVLVGDALVLEAAERGEAAELEQRQPVDHAFGHARRHRFRHTGILKPRAQPRFGSRTDGEDKRERERRQQGPHHRSLPSVIIVDRPRYLLTPTHARGNRIVGTAEYHHHTTPAPTGYA